MALLRLMQGMNLLAQTGDAPLVRSMLHQSGVTVREIGTIVTQLDKAADISMTSTLLSGELPRSLRPGDFPQLKSLKNGLARIYPDAGTKNIAEHDKVVAGQANAIVKHLELSDSAKTALLRLLELVTGYRKHGAVFPAGEYRIYEGNAPKRLSVSDPGFFITPPLMRQDYATLALRLGLTLPGENDISDVISVPPPDSLARFLTMLSILEGTDGVERTRIPTESEFALFVGTVMCGGKCVSLSELASRRSNTPQQLVKDLWLKHRGLANARSDEGGAPIQDKNHVLELLESGRDLLVTDFSAGENHNVSGSVTNTFGKTVLHRWSTSKQQIIPEYGFNGPMFLAGELPSSA